MNKEIFVTDDDCSVLGSLQVILAHAGFHATPFTDGPGLLEKVRASRPACILLDVCMPEMSGLGVLAELAARKFRAPVIMMSGAATIPIAVQAIRRGAFDMIRKPFDPDGILTVVNAAIAASASQTPQPGHSDPRSGLFADTLTPREHEVLEAITEGLSNKETAKRLQISPRTVEIHRARINAKLGARNGADLARIVLNAQSAL